MSKHTESIDEPSYDLVPTHLAVQAKRAAILMTRLSREKR